MLLFPKQTERDPKARVTLKRGVSIIVCCYNSTKRIKQTLEHLARQQLDERIGYEIILVNNASEDNLEEVVEEAWNNCGKPYPLKIIYEPTPGIAFARMCGVRYAQYSYGVFCDDDNWLSSNYLLKVVEILEAKPEVGIVGGCSTPTSETSPPAWFYTKCHYFAIGIQASSNGDITHRGYVWGAGMGFRLATLRTIYGGGVKHLCIGRKKDALTSGEDSEICSWFILAGYRLWYDSALKFKHFMPARRLTDEYDENFFRNDIQSNHNIYKNYLTLLYGVFEHPNKLKFLGMYPAVSRFKAFLKIVSRKESFQQLAEFLKIYYAIRNLDL